MSVCHEMLGQVLPRLQFKKLEGNKGYAARYIKNRTKFKVLVDRVYHPGYSPPEGIELSGIITKVIKSDPRNSYCLVAVRIIGPAVW